MNFNINEELVLRGNQIMSTINGRKLNKNAIIKDTGLNRTTAFSVIIPFLVRCNFIEVRKDKKIHKQKEFLELTKTGKEWIEFIHEIERFNTLFDYLAKQIEEKFESQDKKFANILISDYLKDIFDKNENKLNDFFTFKQNVLLEKGWKH